MTDSPQTALQEARHHLRNGDKAAARALLLAALRDDEKNVQAWYLLSYVVDDLEQALDCAKRAADLAPMHPKVAARLEKLLGLGDGSAKPLPRPPRRRRTDTTGLPQWLLPAAGGGVLLLCCVGLVAMAAISGLGGNAGNAAVAGGGELLDNTMPTLAPTWTTTPTATVTVTPTITPTPTATPLPPPDTLPPALAESMSLIQQEVADVRGLARLREVPQYLVDKPYANALLRESLAAYGGRAAIDDEALVLSTLGLIKPTYDLYSAYASSLADGLGGFYEPWSSQLYVVGDDWTGMERFIYAHEYGHALVDMHVNIAQYGVYPVCEQGAERCQAFRALVEGDATLVMQQWLVQFGTPQDYTDILSSSFDFGNYDLPEQFPPPYISQDVNFPYEYGYDFVLYIHEQGNWAAVDAVYSNPPASTEQIIHPDKYVLGEAPLPVSLPDASAALGNGWRLVSSDTLGQWTTFLLLAYGADVEGQVADETAWAAATGWGGDSYHVYINEAGTTALAAEWRWDTPADAGEFSDALRAHMAGRFREKSIDLGAGECWESGTQTGCMFPKNESVLWLLAPSRDAMVTLINMHPNYP